MKFINKIEFDYSFLNLFTIYDVNRSQFLKIFYILLIMGGVYLFPILMLDRYYIDDLGRSIGGYTGWEKDGRPFASSLMLLINFENPFSYSKTIMDISPIPQLLGLLCLALAGSILHSKLFPKTASFFTALVVFPIIGNPFFLENLSYRFDSFPMSVAVFLGILSAIQIKNKFFNIVIGSAILFLCLGFYQAAANCFLATTFLIFIVSFQQNKKFNFNYLINNLIKFLIAVGIYKFYLIPIFPPTYFYAEIHSTIISLNAKGVENVINNFNIYLKLINLLLIDLPVFMIISILCILNFIYRLFLLDKKILNYFIIILSIIAFFLSVTGILVLLENPVPEPRVLLAFAFPIILILYVFKVYFGDVFKLNKYLLIIPIFLFFNISFGYAAASKRQEIFDRFLVNSIVNNLELLGFKNNDFIFFDGNQPKSPVFKNASKIRIIEKIIPLYFSNNSRWGSILLQHYRFKFKDKNALDSNLFVTNCNTPPIVVTTNYYIYKGEGIFIVAFEDGICRS